MKEKGTFFYVDKVVLKNEYLDLEFNCLSWRFVDRINSVLKSTFDNLLFDVAKEVIIILRPKSAFRSYNCFRRNSPL